MCNQKISRPSSEEYYMNIAEAVSKRASCMGRKVGAILVLEDRIIATGYNGTPEDMTNCDDGGCERCAHPKNYPSGTGYDVCICVYAEQNALLSAARFGNKVQGSYLYSTLRPCFNCTKELLQAKVQAVYFREDWSHPDPELNGVYQIIQARFPGGSKQVHIEETVIVPRCLISQLSNL